MHRFYLSPERCNGNVLQLEDREAHHAINVLRLKSGENITVLNGVGGEFRCIVESSSRHSLTLAVKEKISIPAPPYPITLWVAIPKGKLIESIIQKSVELGVHRIVPLLTERVVTQLDDDGADNKREKWQHVAIEAIKQCGATWLPTVEIPQTISEFLARGETVELPMVGSLQTSRKHPRIYFEEFRQKNGRLPQSAGVWIGPEGDFTLEELKMIEGSGAKPVTLGNLTLRVETAAIYCLSILNYERTASLS